MRISRDDLTHPGFALRKAAQKVGQVIHPGEPWMGRRVIRFCEEQLEPTMSVLEWGSGRSTVWFGRRVGELTSVEYDAAWHARTTRRIEAAGLTRVRCLLVELDDDPPERARPYSDEAPAYVAVAQAFADESLDLVIVDGHYRQACIAAALPKLRPGGLLLVDNTNWMPLSEWGVPDGWPVVHQSANVVDAETAVWRKPAHGPPGNTGRPGAAPLMLGVGWFPDQIGGLNRYFRGLFEALAAGGGAPAAVVLGPATDPPAGVTVAARHGDPLLVRLRRYARAVRRPAAGADLVDAHFALYALVPVLFGPLRRLPLVVHFHGPWRDESQLAGERGLSLAAKRLVERLVYRRAADVVVLSQAFRRVAVERYGVEPWRVHVVPPGVDLERFESGSRSEARARLRLLAGAWIVLAARRLVPRMGLDTLLESWAQAGIGDGQLLVAGDGPERARLEALAESLGVTASVRFLGRVADEELPLYYRAADVSVVPSLELEGFGLAALESLACGTPVVASAVGGLPEAIGTLDPTLLVPAGDADALAARLVAARDGSQPLPAAEACRAHAEAFSWTKAADRNRDVYARAGQPLAQRAIRVVYLDHCARLSGAELALALLLPELEGVDAHVILGEDGPLVQLLHERGVSVEVLLMPRAARDLPRESVRLGGLTVASAAGTALYVARVARRLRRLQPDLVHTNSLKAAVYGALAARLARVPLVWHVRDRVADDYLPRSAVGLVHRLASMPSLVFANSEATLATLGDLSQRHAIIPRVVLFDPVRLPDVPGKRDEAGPLQIGMIGRISPWKGQHVFLEAFARAFPSGDERAVIVGAPLFGEEEYDQRLRRLAAQLGIESRVEFTGFQRDIAAQLARFHILTHASVIAEPFGQVVLEGMAFGLPVIASAAGGPLEVIDPDRTTGVLVPPGDVGALASALLRLASDPGLRARLGEAARIRARDFAPEVIAPRVVEAYRDLLEGRYRP